MAFAGLGVAGWLMNLLADLIFFSKTNKNYYYGITKITLLSYLPWLVLALGYAIALFMLFRREKREESHSYHGIEQYGGNRRLLRCAINSG